VTRGPRPQANPRPPSHDRAESNLRRIATGGGTVFAGGWVSYALSLGFNIVVARRLNADRFGAFTIGMSLAVLLAHVAPLGLNQAVVRYVAIYRGQHDEARIRGTIGLALRVTAAAGAVLGLAMLLAAPLLAERVFNDPSLTLTIRVLACSVPLTGLGELLLATMRAYTRVVLPVLIRSFAAPGLRVLAAVAALLAHANLVGVAAAYTLVEGAALLAAAAAARQVLPGRAAGTAAPPTAEVVRFSWPMALNRVLMGSTNNAEVFMLGALAGSGKVALFAAARRFTIVANAIFIAFGTIFSPMVSDLDAAEQHDHLARLYKAVSRWIFTIGVPVFLVQVLFGGALLSTFGRGFGQGRLALTLLAVGQLANYASGAAGNVLTMTGRSRANLVVTVVHLVLTVLLNLLLIPRLGLLGAALANAVAISSVNAALTGWVYRVVGMHPYSRGWLKPLAAGLVAAAAVAAGRGLLPAGNAGELAGVLLLGVAYLGTLALLAVDADDRVVLRQLARRARRPAAPGEAAADARPPEAVVGSATVGGGEPR
jgi:O-antigen/teichoic acid export membrane protein